MVPIRPPITPDMVHFTIMRMSCHVMSCHVMSCHVMSCHKHRSYVAHTMRLILLVLVCYRLLASCVGTGRRLSCPLQLRPVWAPLAEGQPASLLGQPAFARRSGVRWQQRSHWSPAGRMGEPHFLATSAVLVHPRHSHLSCCAGCLGEQGGISTASRAGIDQQLAASWPANSTIQHSFSKP